MPWSTRFLSLQTFPLLGLDISSSAVKLLELKEVQGGYEVLRFGQYPLVPAVMEGAMVQSIEGLADAVRQLLATLHYPTKSYPRLQVVIAVPDVCTISKTITVSDRLDDVDVEVLVRMELEKFMPTVQEDLCFDFKRLAPVTVTKGNGLKALFIVATRIHYVQHRVAALRHIGLRTRIVDVESLAMARTLPLILAKEEAPTLMALLDISAQVLQVLFFAKGVFLFKHQETPSSHNGINHLPSVDCDALLAGVKRACQFFYAAQTSQVSVSKLFVAGEGAKQAGLCSFLAERLGIPIQIANPFLSMYYSNALNITQLMEDAPLYLTACGLAQRVY